jgi:hypothetical protein
MASVTILIMFMVRFLSWWYLVGWAQVMSSFGPRINRVTAAFSVNQLMRTLFSPWRRIMTYPGASLADKLAAWGDNVFSRTIGFIIRIFVLLTAFLACLVVLVFTVIEVALWPVLPISVIGLIVAGAIW